MDLVPTLERGCRQPARTIGRTVEIVGPPGAGKTTLLAALAERRSDLRPIDHWRQLPYLPGLAKNAVGLLPLFLAQWGARQPLARRDMERMVRLDASRRIAEGWRTEVVVMDQGPIYTLATLRLGGCDPARSERLGIWWNRIVREWARLLDTVVFLEAKDDVLLSRINGRSKRHRLKSDIDADATHWLAMLRDALERTVERFRVCSGLSVLRFDTGAEELARIADRVNAELEGGRAGSGDQTIPHTG